MYRTCMFCNRSLGENQVVEEFPVGRRLAFDSSRGRLWVVCKRCERWNLTPIEERWEAVEACERLFGDTRIRVSTENVGLAKLREGLELVRIGSPMRQEFAAWRYGDQFGRRRKKAFLMGGGALVAFGGLVVGGVATGVISGALVAQSANFWNIWANGRNLVKLSTEDGRVIPLKRMDLLGTRVRSADDGTLRLGIRKGKETEWFEGEEAKRLVGVVMPGINRTGGKRDTVTSAVHEIEHHGHPDRFLGQLIRGDRFTDKRGVPGYVNKMPAPTKLALEMSLHEEQERRALEGELWRLERAWEEAEEIAAISDNLLLPESTEDFIERHREPDPTRAE
ncbi:MAG: hypothetical protein HKO77_00975 [Gemmatimonadetes bacterium]|nr:hypothetical protein [Gemmatimonadota bacterium]NNM35425.1 hypothetical protein [Gemmatimonadota bacterium]